MKSIPAFVAHYLAAPVLSLVALVAGLVAAEGAWNLWGLCKLFGWGVFDHSNSGAWNAFMLFAGRVELGAFVCAVAWAIASACLHAYEPRSGHKTA